MSENHRVLQQKNFQNYFLVLLQNPDCSHKALDAYLRVIDLWIELETENDEELPTFLFELVLEMIKAQEQLSEPNKCLIFQTIALACLKGDQKQL